MGGCCFKSAFYFGVVSLVTLPGFLLHFNFYQHDKGTNLVLNKEHFELHKGSHTCRVYLNEILIVERHSIAWSRKVPWSDYGYIKILLKSGSSVIWSSLLYDLLASKNAFAAGGIAVEQSDEFFPWLNT